MIYDILPEVEEFSEQRGGAISKVVANLVRLDDSRVAVCSASDGSWGLGADRTVVIPALLAHGKLRGRRVIPAWMERLFYRQAYGSLLSRVRDGDTVWCHNQPLIAEALTEILAQSGVKLVYHAHDPHVPDRVRKVFASLRPAAWVFVSNALRERFCALFPHIRDTYVVHNGADDKIFYPLAGGASRSNAVPVILYVGRLHPEKGVQVLVEAMRLLHESGISALCKIIGSAYSGGSKPTRYVKSLYSSSPPNVTLLGYRAPHEIAQEMRAADLLCCPSIWLEAFGSVNIEAMASGIPVVASRVGGIPEIGAEGGVLLVEPGSVVDLADALQKLILDEGLRQKMGAEGLTSFRRRFTWPSILKRHHEIIEQL
jgi:glycosyltransferase involved in cell wall biosynthesis